jgi:hypothetical protein
MTDHEKPKPKRNLFQKPAWLTQQSEASTPKPSTQSKSTPPPPPPPSHLANTASTIHKSPIKQASDADGDNIFRRAKDTYSRIQAENEARERRRAKKRKEKADTALKEQQEEHDRLRVAREEIERQAARETTETLQGTPKREYKRRRITDEENVSIGSPSPSVHGSPLKIVAAQTERRPVVIDDSEDELEVLGERTVTPPVESDTQPTGESQSALVSHDLLADDDIFGNNVEELEFEDPELYALAKARRQQSEHNSTLADSGDPLDKQSRKDPALKIFISSKIPGTQPLIVQRRYQQSLVPVFNAWCKINNIREDPVTNDVYLSYKGEKVYDFQTLETLRVKFSYDVEGNPMVQLDEEDLGGPEDEMMQGVGIEGGVHLVATTKHIEEEEERVKLMMQSQHSAKKEEEEEDMIAQEQEKKEKVKLYKVVLKSNLKEIADLKLILRPVSHSRHEFSKW